MDQCDTVPRHTKITSTCTYQHGKTCYNILHSQKFLWYVYFTFESLIRIFMDIILFSFQPKMMLSSEFSCTKFSLLIDHLQKPRKFIVIWQFLRDINFTDFVVSVLKNT